MTLTGIFTPWAELLCIPCNNACVDSIPQARTVHTDHAESNPTEGHARCDRCDAAVYCEREDVVLCQRVRDAAMTIGGDDGSAIELQQTGGMCVAAGYSTDRHELLITESEEHPQGSEVMLLCVYEIDDDGEPGDAIYSASETVWDAAARARLWEHWMDEYGTDGGEA